MTNHKYSNELIYIRNITDEDTDNIIKWRNSDSVRNNFIYKELFTRESHTRWLENYVYTGKVVQMIIVLKEGDLPVGSVYIRDIDMEKGEGEYGIFIGEESARGKGVGSAACKLMCEYAKEEIGLHKLFLRVYEDNIGAVKSYQNGGFEVDDSREDVIDGRKMIFMNKILM